MTEETEISLVRQRTSSTGSQLMPNLLPKRLFQMLVYHMRSAKIQSPIMIQLKFSSLTSKQ